MATSPGLGLRFILSLPARFLGLWGLEEYLSPFKTWSNLTKFPSMNADLTESMSDWQIACLTSPSQFPISFTLWHQAKRCYKWWWTVLNYCFWYCRLGRGRSEDLSAISNTIYMGKDLPCSQQRTDKLVDLVLPWKQSLRVCMGGHTHNTHKGGALGHSLYDSPLGTLGNPWPHWVLLRVSYTALTNRPIRWWKFVSPSPNSPGQMLWVWSWEDAAVSHWHAGHPVSGALGKERARRHTHGRCYSPGLETTCLT